MDERRMSLIRAARRQDGFTLPELLITLTMALIVAAAALTLLEVTMRKTDETQNRVASVQRGRMAMDTVTRQLRSQVCLTTTTPTPAMSPPAGWGVNTDANNAVFYVDLSDPGAGKTAELHWISYDSTKKQLIEKDYANSSTVAGTFTYPPPASPTRTKVLLDNVVPYGSTPIFTYYAYDDTVNPPRPSAPLTPSAGGGLSAAQEATIARVDVAFRALPEHVTADQRGSSIYQDEIYVRAADPNAVAPTPTCA
jgi:prepilin-type N-terminal cleavage/methylation domain-containing protein